MRALELRLRGADHELSLRRRLPLRAHLPVRRGRLWLREREAVS